MSDKIDYKKIQQIVETAVELKVEEILDQRLGENFLERIDRIENNTDMACKIAKDADEELTATQAKVDKHEDQIIELQKFVGLATA